MGKQLADSFTICDGTGAPTSKVEFCTIGRTWLLVSCGPFSRQNSMRSKPNFIRSRLRRSRFTLSPRLTGRQSVAWSSSRRAPFLSASSRRGKRDMISWAAHSRVYQTLIRLAVLLAGACRDKYHVRSYVYVCIYKYSASSEIDKDLSLLFSFLFCAVRRHLEEKNVLDGSRQESMRQVEPIWAHARKAHLFPLAQ